VRVRASREADSNGNQRARTFIGDVLIPIVLIRFFIPRQFCLHPNVAGFAFVIADLNGGQN